MSDLTSAAPQEVQDRAIAMGWIAPTEFKGKPENFVDAEEFIQRGENFLPFIKAQKRELETKLAGTTERLTSVEAALTKATKALADIEERHTVATHKAVEAAKVSVKAELAKASADGDHKAVAELTEELVELNTATEKPVEKKEEKTDKPAAYVPSAEEKEWYEANSWYGSDKRKTALALGIAQELRDNGDKSAGKTFMNKVKSEMLKTLGEDAGGDKVEGARNGGGDGGGGSPKGKSYSNLPSDAKVACDADAKRFVGEGKKYKTETEWRAKYAAIYFKED